MSPIFTVCQLDRSSTRLGRRSSPPRLAPNPHETVAAAVVARKARRECRKLLILNLLATLKPKIHQLGTNSPANRPLSQDASAQATMAVHHPEAAAMEMKPPPYDPANQYRPDQYRIDAEHLNILSILHYVMAGMTALGGMFPLIYLVFGVAMVGGAAATGNMSDDERTGLAVFGGI